MVTSKFGAEPLPRGRPLEKIDSETLGNGCPMLNNA